MEDEIVHIGTPVLREKAKRVPIEEISSKKIRDLISEMSKALSATDDGIGIAAPQIGVSLRIFLASEEALAIDAGTNTNNTKEKNEWKHYVFINPEIVKASTKKISATEGCLSVPGMYGVVPRSEKVRVRAYDEHGKKFERGASKLFARLLQHEIDHLNGTLYVDRAKKLIEIK